MTRILLLAATAISLAVPVTTADAGTRQKHKYYRQYNSTWQAPARLRTPGPPWAMPNECYTDEGYGRFTPCSRGRGG